ncbi:mRNA-binding ribosome synthesis protein nop7 [Thelotrema lepadinum]|nr:mRNA-binding ribosome synthesis protein nop7 [Thelotrema lepadinum]
MAKIKKKGASGQAKNFITRTQAVRKLQISLPDFRRLCIFKGIYPREPRNKKKASKSSTPSTTFYYTKDIQYLLHEPLLNKFRDHKALSKKIAKSLGRGEVGDAARLEKNGVKRLSLDHIIKERYPTFADALRDLDDALSMLFLFANLPSTSTVPPKTIRQCQRLCHEFQLYVICSHSLRKSFLSIKGIYYQAIIQGQDIMWLVPYKFVQRVTGDVDFRIMGTFIEFYTTLLGFVNFRLYSSIGLVYPPRFDLNSDEQGAELGAFSLEDIEIGHFGEFKPSKDIQERTPERILHVAENHKTSDEMELHDSSSPQASEQIDINNQLEEVEPQGDEAIDKFEISGAGADLLIQPQISGQEASGLFSKTHFFVSRECPRHPLEFILKSFGCKRVSWELVLGGGAFTHNQEDPSITHVIVDRPSLPFSNEPGSPVHATPTGGKPPNGLPHEYRYPGRVYIQPQWVWDCVNSGQLLRPDRYAPGALLPPHLSPWVKPKAGLYDPTVPLRDQEPDSEKDDDQISSSTDGSDLNSPPRSNDIGEHEERNSVGGDALRQDNETLVDVDMVSGNEELEDDMESSAGSDEFTGFDEQDSPADDLYEAELKAEAAGQQYSPRSSFTGKAKKMRRSEKESVNEGGTQSSKARRRQVDEDIERRLGMTSRKHRKLYEKMMFGKSLQDQEAANLRRKRRRIEQITP